MNRSLMNRQMFKMGGVAFPDLSGDGQVTQKDILMGRGVIKKQEGGMVPQAPMMMEEPMIAAPGPAMMPQDPMMMPQEGQASPEGFTQIFEQMQGQMDTLEDSDDLEEMMNAVRGDVQPVEARRAELAEYVGPDDAQQTPDTVLALVQPVMQLAGIDQGIGSLAADEMMETSVEGPMAEGIMSTVNMAPEMPAEAAMMEVGSQPPVNFNQGGAVQYFADENLQRVAVPNTPVIDPALQRQQELFNQQQTLFGQLVDPEQQAKDLEEQRRLTQSQILFDVAQGALGFATAGERNVSPAERLAQSFTPVLGNIGARAGEFGKFKQAQQAEGRQLDQMALQSASQLYGAERASEIAKEDKPIPEVYTVTITNKDGTVTTTTRGVTQGQQKKLFDQHGQENVNIEKIFKPTAASKAENFVYNGGIVSAQPGTPRYNRLIAEGAPAAADVSASAVTTRKQYTLTKPVTIGDTQYAAGSSPYLSDLEFASLTQSFGNDVITAYVAPVSEKDFFSKHGMSQAKFEALSTAEQQYLQGLPVITDQMYFQKFGMDKNEFLTLTPNNRQRLLGIEPEYRFERIDNGESIDIVRFDLNDPDSKGVSIYSDDIVQDPELFKITIPNAEGVVTSTIADISTPEGQALLKQVNDINKTQPGAAAMQKIGTESMRLSAFLVPNTTPGGGAALRMSYDGGKTYIGEDGLPRALPSDVVPVGDQVAYDVYRSEKVRNDAKAFLSANDTALAAGMGFRNEDGTITEITKEDKKLVRDALAEVRAGTGVWSSIFAVTNAVGGGVFAPETFSELFKGTEEGRQFTKLVYVLGRSALASSPRFAVTDLEVTGQLFPNTDTFFANPVSEANKLISLVDALNTEEIRLQRLRASDSPVDSAVLATAEQKLGEIARLKNLLGPVARMAATASSTNVSAAQDLMRDKVNRGRK